MGGNVVCEPFSYWTGRGRVGVGSEGDEVFDWGVKISIGMGDLRAPTR